MRAVLIETLVCEVDNIHTEKNLKESLSQRYVTSIMV